MICPVDGEAMLAIEYRGVEFDYCPHCGGIWLDAGELELLASFPDKSSALFPGLTPAPQSSEKRLRCPRCFSRMDKAFLPSLPNVLLDTCKHGDGYWFDRNELQQIILHMHSTTDATDGVLVLLQDIFASDADVAERRSDECY